MDWTLYRNDFGRLVLVDAQGTAHTGVVPVRAFPLAAPHEGLSLVGPDGHELAWVDRLGDLPPETRRLIEDELAPREFVPTIQRLLAVSGFATPSTWRVATDRGPLEFVLKAEEDIRRLEGGALLINSSEGLQLRVSDRFGLDRASRRLLERFL
jgi:hypothetical protein